MSATTEKLLEDIEQAKRSLEEAVEASKLDGHEAGVAHFKAVLLELNQRLTKANEALNEGAAKVLKG
jgi:hypothetical protein